MPIGFTEFAILALVVLLLFGGGKISGLMGDLGRGLGSLKRGAADSKDEGFLGGKGSGPAAPAGAESARGRDRQNARTRV